MQLIRLIGAGALLLFWPLLQVTALEDLESEIDASRFLRHLEFLGSDELGGRGPGSPGLAAAAAYIAQELDQWGLEPPIEGGSYFQRVPMRGSQALPDSEFRLHKGETDRLLELGDDYLLLRMGATTFVPRAVPMVFGGFGIVAPEYDYNSYQTLDVANKIVVLLTGEPESSDPGYFRGRLPTVHGLAATKHRMAIARGARGTMLIPAFGSLAKHDWTFWKTQFSFEQVTLPYGPVGSFSVLLKPALAEYIFQGAQGSFEEILALAESGELEGFELPLSASFHGSFRQREFIDSNVVGLMRGRDADLDETYLLVSAHYDGLGIGPAVNGDSIYNGVADNAAGVSAVLEMIRLLASASEPPRRSILFLFTTGEEEGLLGSTYYVDHPVVPLWRTVANVNVDGLALFDRFRDVLGIGGDVSTLGATLSSYLEEQGLDMSEIPSPLMRREAFIRSDQMSFAEAGVPAIQLLEGFSYVERDRTETEKWFQVWTESIYHTPRDDLSQNMNLDAARQHTAVILGFILKLANSEKAAEWHPGIPFIHARLQSIAEGR